MAAAAAAEGGGAAAAFLTELNSDAPPIPSQSPSATPTRNRHDGDGCQRCAGGVEAAVLSAELRACRRDFAAALEAATGRLLAAQQAAAAREVEVLEGKEVNQRQQIVQREMNFRAHYALHATAQRAGSFTRTLQATIASRNARIADLERQNAAATMGAGLAKARIDALEDALGTAHRLIEELRAEIKVIRRNREELTSSTSISGSSATTDPREQCCEAAVPVPGCADDDAAEIARLRQYVEDLEGQLDRLASEAAAAQARAPPTEPNAALLATLSERTQLVAELDEENRRLKEEIVLLEARCVTTETRLHHSVEEGVAASILLERGMGRLKGQREVTADTTETKRTLIDAAMTLRLALEREGYDVTTLPLAPNNTLGVAYLRQILHDHAEMCAAHFQRGGAGSGYVVRSATHRPLVHRSGASS